MRSGAGVATPRDYRGHGLDVALHRLVDRLAVAGGEQVEEQATGDRGDGRGGLRRAPAASSSGPCATAGSVSGPTQRLDDPVEQRERVRAALQRLRVDLERQPLVRPQRRVGGTGPTCGASSPRAAHRRTRRCIAVQRGPLLLLGMRITSISGPSREPESIREVEHPGGRLIPSAFDGRAQAQVAEDRRRRRTPSRRPEVLSRAGSGWPPFPRSFFTQDSSTDA